MDRLTRSHHINEAIDRVHRTDGVCYIYLYPYEIKMEQAKNPDLVIENMEPLERGKKILCKISPKCNR